MREHLRALLWAQYRMMVNRWTIAQSISTVIMVVAAAAFVLLACAAAIGLAVLGYHLPTYDFTQRLLILDVLTLVLVAFWAMGILMETQRSDTFDLRRLLYLPMRLTTVVGLNFVLSLVTPVAIFFVLSLTGLVVGLTRSLGPIALLAMPLGAAFYLMMGAIAYYVRGIFTVLMENKRRRRLLLTLIPLLFVLLGNGPWLLMQIVPDFINPEWKTYWAAPGQLEFWLGWMNKALPPLWLPYGVATLTAHQIAPALLGMLGLTTVSAAGLYLGYRNTVRFYQGISKTRRTAATSPHPTNRLVVKVPPTLPGFAADTSAMALVALRTCLRHPQMRIAAVSAVILPALFLMIFASGDADDDSEQMLSMLLPICILTPLLSLSQITFNIFGTDRDGFQGLILLPTARYKYIVAKNLAFFPFTGGIVLLSSAIATLLTSQPVSSILTGLVLAAQATCLIMVVGNFVSLYLPYNISYNTMRHKKRQGNMQLAVLLSIPTLGFAALPIAFCMFIDNLALLLFDFDAIPLKLPSAVLFALLTLLLYRLTLPLAGRLLQQREQRILEALRKDRE